MNGRSTGVASAVWAHVRHKAGRVWVNGPRRKVLGWERRIVSYRGNCLIGRGGGIRPGAAQPAKRMCNYERRRWQLILTAESGIRFRGCSLVRLGHDVSPVVAFDRFCLFDDDLERKRGSEQWTW
jgi:hypothetical protein